MVPVRRALERFVRRAMIATLLLACSEQTPEDDDALVVGAALPFTGEGATIGRNLEQALLLAIEDVNQHGGVRGRPLRLESRDSNSGSERGLRGVLDLLYNERTQYLIGPEENELANAIVADIKGLDIINVLPGHASPSIERVGKRGAWLRLPPSPLALGCGLTELARELGVRTANTLVAQDDFNQSVASEFATEFFGIGGNVLPSTTVRTGAQSYAARTEAALATGADRTLLIVNPTTAATLLTEWAVGAHRGAWMFGPTLQTPGFLQNIPHRSLDGTYGVSPTLSLTSECEAMPSDYRGPLSCKYDNAEAFSDYYARRWGGDRPFPAAHFYYDAVVLLALGLNYAEARLDRVPTASELHSFIIEMTKQATALAHWARLGTALKSVSSGTPLGYVGAAAEYQFDQFGAAKHLIFDYWRIERHEYVDEGTLQARCQRQPK